MDWLFIQKAQSPLYNIHAETSELQTISSECRLLISVGAKTQKAKKIWMERHKKRGIHSYLHMLCCFFNYKKYYLKLLSFGF